MGCVKPKYVIIMDLHNLCQSRPKYQDGRHLKSEFGKIWVEPVFKLAYYINSYRSNNLFRKRHSYYLKNKENSLWVQRMVVCLVMFKQRNLYNHSIFNYQQWLQECCKALKLKYQNSFKHNRNSFLYLLTDFKLKLQGLLNIMAVVGGSHLRYYGENTENDMIVLILLPSMK